MRARDWMVALLAGVTLVACAKKPKPAPPPPEPPPPRVAEPPPPPPEKPTGPSEAELRRQRIQAAIAETCKPVYFAYDQSSLTDEARRTLDAIGSLMKQYNEVTLRCEGHTDERGTNEYNLALGQHRADAVKDYLSHYGVADSRLSTISYGEEKPAKDGHDESAWALNRRVEFSASF